MNKSDALRIKRYRKAFGDEDGVSELTDEEVLIRINVEKAHYRAMNLMVKGRIAELEAM